MHSTFEIGYDTAIMLLNKRYGNPHSLLASYRKEIKLLAPIETVDAISPRKFYNFVLKFKTFTKRPAQTRTLQKRQKPYLFMCQDYL